MIDPLLEHVEKALNQEISRQIEAEVEATKERILKNIRERIPYFAAEISKHYLIYRNEGRIVIEVKS